MSETQEREKKRARVKDSEKPEVVDETPGTWILAVDVEVSGMSLIDNFVIEFAAVVQRVGATEPFNEFYRYLGRDPPPNKKWGQMTLRGFWLNPEKGVDGKTPFAVLEERCKDLKPVPRLEATRAFIDWARVMRMRIPVADRVIVVSDTAGFDYAWLSMLMSELKSADDDSDCNLDHLFCEYQPVCDMSSFYFGVAKHLGVHGAATTALDALNVVGFPEWVEKHATGKHHPLDDAKCIAAKASFLVSLVKNGASI